MIRFFIVFLILLLSHAAVCAENYHVDETGGAANMSECGGSDPGNGYRCSLSQVNGAYAGDNIYLYDDGGNISDVWTPSNSGTLGNEITIQAASGESPVIDASADQITITSENHIIIDGIEFSGGSSNNIFINNFATHIEVKNCTFGGSVGVSLAISSYDGVDYDSPCSYIYVHDNTFNAQQAATSEETESDTINIYYGYYCRIIDNIINNGGGHSAITLQNGSTYNVVRGNQINLTTTTSSENEALDAGISLNKNSNHNLIEENILHDQQGDANTQRTEGLKSHTGQYNIWRKNIVYDWDRYGWGCYSLGYKWNIEYNAVYNNTFYDTQDWGGGGGGVININAGANSYARYNQYVNNIIMASGMYGLSVQPSHMSRVSDNVHRNNILNDISSYDVRRGYSYLSISEAESSYPSEYSDNFTITPTFADAANGDFTALNGSSPQVDAGGWLTTITSATGSGTSFNVDSSICLYDGHGISGETGDTIKTASGETTTITSISGNTIMVDPSISWVQNEGLALYYEGTAPDIGAEEYQQTSITITTSATD